MTMHAGDTIVAASTAAVPAERAIVRTSGPSAASVAGALGSSATTTAARATAAPLRFAGLTCPAWVYAFPGPHSYTGEDVVEYHLPGNPTLVRLLTDELVTRGLRPAEAGEFTARAYFAGRLDLTAVEGVAATIAAADAAELAAARQLLAGELARCLGPITDAIAQTLALVELGIDFAEEDVTFLAAEEVRRRIAGLMKQLAVLENGGAAEMRVTDAIPRFVLTGRPNAGKSTLLNALAGRDRAVASAVAGTTRDAISIQLELPRGRVEVIDTAGIEDEASAAPAFVMTPLDRIAVDVRATATNAVEVADRLLLVRDVNDRRPPARIGRRADLCVLTKGDLASEAPVADGAILVSATLGTGLARLRVALDELAFGSIDSGRAAVGRSLLNARHRAAITNCTADLTRAAAVVAPEQIAAELRAALDAVGSITGSVTPDDVLGRIFSTFCIGK